MRSGYAASKIPQNHPFLKRSLHESLHDDRTWSMKGNGQPRVRIDILRLGLGWVLVKAGEHGPLYTLMDWPKENPRYRVRNTLPIVTHGHTFAIHVWFDGE